MKITPRNIARFWHLLMFPPSPGPNLRQRLHLKGDPPWEPWLHCAVWISVFAVLGSHYLVGITLDCLDWIWIFLGLVSPPVGFFSVWMLVYNTGGKSRYIAMWMRLAADFGLVVTILIYQISRLGEGNHLHPLMANIVLAFSGWYMGTLVVRDIRLVHAVEKLANSIYQDDGEAVRAWTLVNILGQEEGSGE